ncbi:MAG: hypothetical protein AAFP77_26500 [Bacteroidota bacterium]
MNRIIAITGLFLSLSLFTLSAQDIDQRFYQAYLENDLDAWSAAIAELSRSYEQSQDANLLLLMAKGAYGAIGSCFAQQDMDKAAEWTDQAEEYALLFLDHQKDHAEGKALLAGIYGMKIGLKPMRGMTLGPKSSRLLTEAIAKDDNCALAYYHLGTSAYNTPATWGGSVEKAATYLQDAKERYEQGALEHNWEYLNALAWLGMSHHQMEQYTQAQQMYQLALQHEPNFGWVKYQLLPKTQEAMR